MTLEGYGLVHPTLFWSWLDEVHPTLFWSWLNEFARLTPFKVWIAPFEVGRSRCLGSFVGVLMVVDVDVRCSVLVSLLLSPPKGSLWGAVKA